MKPNEALSFFGTQIATARALGMGQPSVSKWFLNGEIPELRQYQIELATNGALKADLPALRNVAPVAVTAP